MNKPKSMVTQLTAWFVFMTFILIFISTLVLYWSLDRALRDQDNSFLSDKIQAVKILLDTHPGDFHSIKFRVEEEWSNRKSERVYVKILDGEGNPITETKGFSEITDKLFDGLPIQRYDLFKNKSQRVKTDSGNVFKAALVSIPSTQSGEKDKILKVALDRTSEENFFELFESKIFLALLFSFILTAALGRRIAIRSLRPISDIVKVVKNISSTTMHERINLDKIPVELQTLTETFNDMMDRLSYSFETISQFSSDIAHDLRTPINNLRGEIEVALGRSRSVEEYREVLTSSLEECVRISSMIDSLLFLSRAESPNTKHNFDQIKIDEEIAMIVDFYDASLVESGLKLHFHVPHFTLSADRVLFQRALSNLISNSIKYTNAGGAITVSAFKAEGHLKIEISDTGIGIPEEHLSKVFDRFYRVDSSRSEKQGGFGLGLSIVKSIMAIHHGSISIESKVQIGTKVTLLFPVA